MSEEAAERKLPVQAILIFLVLVSLAGNAFLGSMYWQTRSELAQLRANPQQEAQEELDAILAEVSSLITLPEGLVPVLATVNNADSLRERQVFFENAQNGDKLLLYTAAEDVADRKAYLYRPSTKQLINVAPINVGGQIQAQEDTFSMDIRNGTPTEGLEDQMESLLGNVFPNASVGAKGIAARSDYEASALVQVNASDELAQKVSQLFNVELVDLPSGETSNGDVDLILILGGGEAATEGEAAEAADTAATPAPTEAPAAEGDTVEAGQ